MLDSQHRLKILMVWLTLQHPDIVSLCSMAKLFATENCFDIVNTALQVICWPTVSPPFSRLAFLILQIIVLSLILLVQLLAGLNLPGGRLALIRQVVGWP
jgi:hypothetical protein